MAKSGTRRPFATFADLAMPDGPADHVGNDRADEEHAQRIGRLHATLLVDEMITAQVTGAETPFDLDAAVAAVSQADTTSAAAYMSALCESLATYSRELRSAIDRYLSGHDSQDTIGEVDPDWLDDQVARAGVLSDDEAYSLVDRVLGLSRAIADRAQVSVRQGFTANPRPAHGTHPGWPRPRPAERTAEQRSGGLGRAATAGARHTTTAPHRPGGTRSAG